MKLEVWKSLKNRVGGFVRRSKLRVLSEETIAWNVKPCFLCFFFFVLFFFLAGGGGGGEVAHGSWGGDVESRKTISKYLLKILPNMLSVNMPGRRQSGKLYTNAD